MKSRLPKSLFASLSLLTLSAMSTQAAVIVTLPTASTAGSIQITQDINFTITTAGSVQVIVFDEWVTSDGSLSSFPQTSISPSSLSFSLNGGATQNVTFYNPNSFIDNVNTHAGSVTANDGILQLNSSIPVAVNNVFTVKAATYTLAAGSLPTGFNPQAGQTFTGNAFLTNNAGSALSGRTSVVAVPEPSSALLLVGGLGTLFLRRRKA